LTFVIRAPEPPAPPAEPVDPVDAAAPVETPAGAAGTTSVSAQPGVPGDPDAGALAVPGAVLRASPSRPNPVGSAALADPL
jgi:hypothetical protein